MSRFKSVLKDVALAAVVCVAVDATIKFVRDHFLVVDDDDDCCDDCCECCACDGCPYCEGEDFEGDGTYDKAQGDTTVKDFWPKADDGSDSGENKNDGKNNEKSEDAAKVGA